MKRVITSGGGYGYAPETHLYYVVVLSCRSVGTDLHDNQSVQMRLQLSDVCGEGRVVAGASRYESMLVNTRSQMHRCVSDVDT